MAIDYSFLISGVAVAGTFLFFFRNPLKGIVRHCFSSQPPEEPISKLVAEYAHQLDIGNVQLWTAEQYLEEFARVLEFRFFSLLGIESLPGGHSWVELARAVISSGISPDLTDVNILANAYCILMEKGPGNELITEALKILQLWQHGLPIS